MTLIGLTLLAILFMPFAAILMVIDFFRWSGRDSYDSPSSSSRITRRRLPGESKDDA